MGSWLGFAWNGFVKMFSHSLGPVALDYEEPKEEEEEIVDPSGIPKPPYAPLSEQGKMEVFDKWMLKFGKKYKNDPEKMKRFTIFKESMERVDGMCVDTKKKDKCSFALTVFSDLTDDEFSRRVGSF